MNEDIMQKLGTVIGALNSISVSGKQNLANLSGSIAVLEEIAAELGEYLSTCTNEDSCSVPKAK